MLDEKGQKERWPSCRRMKLWRARFLYTEWQRNSFAKEEGMCMIRAPNNGSSELVCSLALLARFVGSRLTPLFVAILLVGGCATDWQKDRSHFKTVQTELRVESQTEGKVFVDNRYVGTTPLKVPLEYQQQVDKKVRNVSYWETNPGTALLLTVGSLGLYLPFSAIPVETQSEYSAQDVFKNNVFSVKVEAEGCEQWQESVTCQGENTIVLKPVLQRATGQ